MIINILDKEMKSDKSLTVGTEHEQREKTMNHRKRGRTPSDNLAQGWRLDASSGWSGAGGERL